MSIDQVLVTRLAEMYDPFEVLGISPEEVEGVQEVTEHADYLHRDKEYHLGRVAHFVRELKEGKTLKPLDVDNRCDCGQIYPEPIIMDGNHRFAAAIISKQKKIGVDYGGLVFVLNYLTGKTKKLPSYRGY